MLAEPAFSRSAAWPPPGFDGLPPEPDDPRPAISGDARLFETRLPATEWLAGSDKLDRPADEPLQQATPGSPARRKAWKAAIFASCLLHVAVALAFLTRADDSVDIAGSDQAGVMLLGNAPDDQSASGDGSESTNVTLITMLDAKPVATVDAETVTAVDTVRPIEESLKPVEEVVEAEPSEPVPDRVAETSTQVLQPSNSDTATAEAEAPAPAALAPDILTAQEVEATQETVQPHTEQPVDSEAAESPAATDPPDIAETITPVETEEIPVPEPKPIREKQPVAEAKVELKKPERKPAAEKPEKRSERKTPAKPKAAEKAEKSKKKAGSRGRNETDSRRGVADGQVDGRKNVAGKGGKASAAGNAAVSNYPGKVAAKLRRAVRSVSRSARAKARSDVLVSFTVTAGGGLGGVRVARSSGSPELDKAALGVVRRAAPFPPIPLESGRRNWSFTLPLGLH